ncbi:MAG TPA: single-stranded-DNA-specific exonuclease RecJ [Candidatus Saccharimonadales bacterium]|nr:single-stranded-DNA-specific exonuclease RecJ [Candidatus Saccharimonadales bacterium]
MEAQQTTESAPDELQIPTLVRDLLRKRGLTDEAETRRFLEPDYLRDLADPYLMTGVEAAAQRIAEAAAKKQNVAVYGDYDVDGIVATALMKEVLEMQGLQPITYVPDRYEEGYGLHLEALKQLKADGIDLVVTVDCGITSVAEAAWARKNGLDLIVTDHHDVPEVLPQAVAVINPKQSGDKYPFKELAGVGVAFTVARGLQKLTGKPPEGHEKWLLDLVAMGTICDVMPLVGENRVLARFGLLVLAKTRRVGLVALAQSAGIDLDKVKAYHLGFMFGPRLNAAGRLEHANLSLDLVTTKDPIAAQQMAFKLEELNAQRQMEQQRITDEADAQAAAQSDDPVLVLADPGWSHGVVGIVASKLAEKYHKPTLILQVMGESAKGSGRSAGGYNLIEGLRSAEGLFHKLGGHHHAAGFTLPTASLEALRQALTQHHGSVASGLAARSSREAELPLEDLAELDWQLFSAIEMLEPFGSGNPQPTFGADKLKVISVDTVGQRKNHLKMKLAGESGIPYEGIGFNLTEKYPNLKSGQIVDAVFFLEQNQFNGRSSLQLVILQIQ